MLSWFLSARAALVLTRATAIACFLGVVTSVAILVLLGVTRHPAPEVFPLYALPIASLVLGQLVAIAWAAARSSASEGRAYPRSMRIGSGNFFQDLFGPDLPRKVRVVFLAFFYLAIACAAVCMIVGGISGPTAETVASCAYTSNDHGRMVCLSAIQAAAQQGFAPAIFFGFDVFQAGSAVGGVLQQRAFDLRSGTKPHAV